MRILFLLFLIGLPTAVSAQTTQEDDKPKWWDGFTIRHSFDGSGKEEKAAEITFTNPDRGRSVSQIDMAVKVDGFNFAKGADDPDILLFPSLEWHRSTSEDSRNNKAKLQLNYEQYTGTGISDLAWIFLLKPSVERDFEQDQTVSSMSFQITTYKVNDPKKWWPGGRMFDGKKEKDDATGKGNRIGQYFPYIGVEYFNQLPIEKDGAVVADSVSEWFATFRVRLELYPFNTFEWDPFFPYVKGKTGRFQLAVEHTHRHRTTSSQSVSQSNPLTTISAKYYFDSARKAALSLTYEEGRNPKNNFDDQRKTVLGMAIKF